MKARCFISVIGVVWTFMQSTPGLAQTPSFTLDLAAAPSTGTRDVALTVGPGAVVPFNIIRTGPPSRVNLDVSAFTGDQQPGFASVTVAQAADSGPGTTHLTDIEFSQPVLALKLRVQQLPAGGKFSGNITLSVSDAGSSQQAMPTVWHVVLTPAADVRPATLIVQPSGAISIATERPFCLLRLICFGGDPDPVVTLQVRDKTGVWQLNGIAARLESGFKTSGPQLDLKRNISAEFADQPTDIFASADASNPRIVKSGDSSKIRLQFHDLEAGEYTLPLQISANDSGDDALQRLTVTLQVRSHWLSAALVLVLAGFVSFLATRVVTVLRQRAVFLQRLQILRPNWLNDERPTLAVIWLRATLRQAQDLSSRYWLSGQSEIDAMLASAQNMLTVLDLIRQVRGRINAIPYFEVKRRALWGLDDLAKPLAAAPLTDQDVNDFKARLAKLDEWSNPDKTEPNYWADVLISIKARISEVHEAELPEDAKELAKKLLEKLKSYVDATPPTLKEKTTAEDDCARLSILWEVRSKDDLLKKIAALGKKAPIKDYYDTVDNWHWERLKSLGASNGLAIEAPSASPDLPTTYAPIVLRLQTKGEPRLVETYLMTKKLTYRWTINIAPKKRGPITLKVTSADTQVAQFSPVPGKLTASVQIQYEALDGPEVSLKDDAAVDIAESENFGVWQIFETADVLSFILVMVTSVVSGIGLFALAPTFGSFKDYLSLFTWGAGLDQGKNFVQSMATSNKT